MFNPKRIAAYLHKLIGAHLPVVVVIIVLVALTGLWRQEGSFVEEVLSRQFWIAMAMGMIPTLVAILAVYALVARFVRSLYQTGTFSEASSFVRHSLFGLPAFGPWQRVAGGDIDGGGKGILKQVGGPGHLVVYNDNAILLERGGRFTRVEMHGFPRLERFEKVYWVIDLRPMRRLHSVKAMSKEGIPITCEADVTFQVDSDGRRPTYETPFPTSKKRVFQAATCTWIREGDQPPAKRIMDWAGRVIISETEGNLRTILARYPLDRLIGVLSGGDERSREEIRAELERRLQSAAPKLGAKILGVELGDIRVEDEITSQWIDLWKAEWERRIVTRKGEAQAVRAEQIEDAKTRAQVMLLATITEAFEPLVEQQQVVTSKLVLARLFMVLSRAPVDPLTRVNLPREAVHTLQALKDLII
jgi:hypothetical protein